VPLRPAAGGGSWPAPAVTGTVLAHLDDDAPPGPAAVPASGPAGESPARSGPGSAAGAGPIAGAAWAAGPGTGLAEPVTLREREVLTLVCEGLPNAEIGERLHLAESTVKTHIKALLAKTGRRNRVELIVHAFRHGLVDYRR